MNLYRRVGRINYRPYSVFALLVISVYFLFWAIYVSAQAAQPFESLVDEYALVTCTLGQQPFLHSVVDAVRSFFLHTSVLDLVFNMLTLWVFGPLVERWLGHRNFLAFFLLTGFIGHGANLLLGGGECQTLFGPSGAIAGVLGAFLLLYPTRRVDIILFGRSYNIPSGLFIMVYLLASVFGGNDVLSGQVTPFWDELSGFAFGMIAVFVLTLFKPAPKVDPFEHLDD